jgi:hypothetical protein
LGTYQVSSTRLFEAITYLLKPEIQPGLSVVQVPSAGTQVEFPLHELRGRPKVPLTIPLPPHEGAKPPVDLKKLEVALRGNGLMAGWQRRGGAFPDPCVWNKRHFQAWLQDGDYNAELTWKDGTRTVGGCTLAPPGSMLKDFRDA